MKHRSSAPSPHKHWFHTRPQTCPEDFSSPKKHVRVSCWRERPLQREARCSLDKIYTQAAKMSCLIKDEACCFEEGGVVFLFTWMSKNKTLLSLKTKLTEDLTCSVRHSPPCLVTNCFVISLSEVFQLMSCLNISRNLTVLLRVPPTEQRGDGRWK